MENLSIIIPSYEELYLNKTIDSVLKNATGDIEIIVVIDGYVPKEEVIKDSKVVPLYLKKNVGMRGAIDAGIKKATGKYIMKLDAHCIVAKGFDEILKRDCKKNWLMIPRRYPLNAEKWRRGISSGIKDYHYIHYPVRGKYGYNMVPQLWKKKNDKEIDDVMTMQGSCWFAHKDYFMDKVGYLNTERYGSFAGDQLEIGMAYWLNGGRMKVNKRTWYAHLFKNQNYYDKFMAKRKYKINRKAHAGYRLACYDWFEEVKLLVEKFWPVPSWPEDRNWKL